MPKRDLTTETVRRFRGLNQLVSLTIVPPGQATDLANILISQGGSIEKFRVPFAVDAAPTGPFPSSPIRNFHNFQFADLSVNQIVVGTGSDIYQYNFTSPGPNWSIIMTGPMDTDPLNGARFDFLTANNICFMLNGLRTIRYDGVFIRNWGIARPATAPGPFVLGVGVLNLATGRRYRVAFKNNLTGHVSSASDASISTGPLVNNNVTVTAPAIPDPQTTHLVWFATLDGGGDYFFHSETTVAVPNLIDNLPDSSLNKAIRAPLINEPPPAGGKYMTKWGGRICIVVGQEVAYSGYERILIGRPEESFPPSNRIRLQAGADTLGGIGALQAGIVVWSFSNEMFMARGKLEDVVAGAPVAFTAFLEVLPWKIGISSHFSIQNYDRGLVFLDSSLNVRAFDGYNEPVIISDGAEGILNRITRSQTENIRSGIWTWLNRQWYVLFIPVDGSTVPNKLLIFDLDRDSDSNVGILVCDVTGDSMQVVEDNNGDEHLIIGSMEGGFARFKEIQLRSYTINGVVTNPPANNPNKVLPAWYRTTFGNSTPEQRKFFRRIRVIVSGGLPTDFRLRVKVYDKDFAVSEYIDGKLDKFGRFALNRKARRIEVEVVFPDVDASVSLDELSAEYFFIGEN